MTFNFGDVTNETFSEDLRRAAGFKPFLLEDAKTILARYEDSPTNIQKNMSDTQLYQRAVSKVIEKYRRDRAATPQEPPEVTVNPDFANDPPIQLPADLVLPPHGSTSPGDVPNAYPASTAVQPADVMVNQYPSQTSSYVQPQAYPALTTSTSYSSPMSLTTVHRILLEMNAPSTLVPPPTALVNETALRNYLIQLGYR